jgi:hypothetical protein
MVDSLHKKLTAIFLSAFICGFALARDSEKRQFGDWLYKSGFDKAEPFCYAMTIPFRTKTNDDKREDIPFVLVRKQGDQMYTIGLIAKANINIEQPLEIRVNRTVRALKIKSDKYGWTYSANLDAHLINDFMLDDQSFTIRSQSEMGEYYLDYYSLKGFKKMITYMQANCKVGR